MKLVLGASMLLGALWQPRAVFADGTLMLASSSVLQRRVEARPGSIGVREKMSRERTYDAHLVEAASVYQIPVALLRAVLRVESDGDPTVVSDAGAMGLMQLMPGTAREMGVLAPFDVRESIYGGARYLRLLANRWDGDLVLTIASYNAGPGAVERHRGVPPYRETRRYVRRVLRHYMAYREGRRLPARDAGIPR